MQRVLAGRIALIIAHRLSTVRGADRIIVIRDGRIAEQGSHEQLMAARGHYFEMYRQQSLQESSQSLTLYDPQPAG